MPLACRLVGIALLACCGGASIVSAAGLSFFSKPTKNVFIVTDVTEAGKKLEPPTKGKPVYCAAFSYGCDFGSIPGDKLPNPKAMLDLIVKILAEQGFQGNDEKHPPTLVLSIQWGWLEGNLGDNLAYLGGDKLDLMWETESYAWINANVLRRGMRGGTAARVMEISEEDLYAITICAFDYHSVMETEKSVLLWQTRIAVPTTGFSMAEALPRIVALAAPNIGRETKLPVITKAPLDGSIEYGELTVVGVEGEEDAPPPAPP
jgi:hypothetical protein